MTSCLFCGCRVVDPDASPSEKVAAITHHQRDTGNEPDLPDGACPDLFDRRNRRRNDSPLAVGS